MPHGHSSDDPPIVVTLGNPNTGKSTLFNALTGMRQQVGNFPGVTVEYVRGTTQIGDAEVVVVDLPGTYSLAAQSPDEMVAIDVLLGRIAEVGQPNLAVIVVDASNLRRNLFLASQVLELPIPAIIALNMVDSAESCGITIDPELLAQELQVPVVAMCANRGVGIADLRAAIDQALHAAPSARAPVDSALRDAAQTIFDGLQHRDRAIDVATIERALIDVGGYAEQRLLAFDPALRAVLAQHRERLGHGRPLAAVEAQRRYTWIAQVIGKVEQRAASRQQLGDFVDKILNHPFLGSIAFVLTMAIVFQSVFAWAAPVMDLIDAQTAALGVTIEKHISSPLLASFLSDGVVAGVGSVIIFLPQIIILFAFIILLEDTGYMSRAAFLMDRLMRWCGLSGQSFIPMLSSFACAVPGIMGTRVIPGTRDRIATILAAPFMTCSARLPVYALLISAFVPPSRYLGGWINLQGIVLLGFYLLGIGAGVVTAFCLKRTLLRGPTATFLLELPPYRVPNLRSMWLKLMTRARIFLKRAGTVIFTVAVVVWLLATFPLPNFDTQETLSSDPATARQLALESSYLGSASKTVAPIFSPLGWDWKVTAAVIASFPAREVVIAVLGTIYAIDAQADSGGSLIERIRRSKRPDGSAVFTLPMALGLMTFYALCLQCVATIAVMRRETNSWRWPLFAWLYMTTLGYLGALFCFQFGTALSA